MAMFIFPTAVHYSADEDGTFAGHLARDSVNPGFDFAASYGSAVYAAMDGVVSWTANDNTGSGGRMIHIEHDWIGWGTEYLHLSKILVSSGQHVSQGDVIAHSGASANGSDYGTGGPHLHFSLKQNGTNVDPMLWLHESEAAPPLAPNQRLVTAGPALCRTAPNTSPEAQIVDRVADGAVLGFSSWLHGEAVGGNDIWFTPNSVTWFWSGSFGDTGTHDLVEIVPTPPIPDPVDPTPTPDPVDPTPTPTPTPEPTVPDPTLPDVPNLGNIITNPLARRVIYGVYAVAAFVTGGLDQVIGENPEWLNVTIKFIAYIGIGIGSLALLNAPTTAQAKAFVAKLK